MQVQDIYIYPIKSLGGIRLDEAEVLTKGFRWDRRWMLVDDTGTFMTQRALPIMALLQVNLNDQGLEVLHKLHPHQKINIPFTPETDQLMEVSVWDDVVSGQIVNPEVDHWFSKMLATPCHLVFMPENTTRSIKEKYAVNDETVSFADAMPYLLISQASLDDLNQRLELAVPMERFRPNIVISGCEAFEEDGWEQLQIGKCTFKVTKPCARCVMTTVDQQTGTKGKEPLKTLSTYRLKDKKVLFGQNMIALERGRVKIGDKVNIIQ
ncbi:MOSC domain-containing protein [Echinicola strongylocentroti]|uniref:MOSC domain-containing protein n=1 Tax=Echinicola strongylocentroti TaxID=1795355 RepID=A0A2Z4IL34_9BACT|nr:MOSC N-terminal beta barrel domain-containing protein [Echinicola strongylocentroti]AWW31278.1 MOSC domain-containing protein [Echinicola strongylocentroti]